ncbi:MAG TPA: hypothetical protein VMS71_08105 [Candidatus Acidoferrum sp.]|nr:hypothetical protein [Candidatus Acidoferrum sp.]
MEYQGTKAIIQRAKAVDDPSLDSLAKSILERSYREPGDVVGLMHTDSQDTKQKASAVALKLGNLVLPMLLDSLPVGKPNDLIWELQQALTLQNASRAKITKILLDLLKDQRELEPDNPFASAEDRAPVRRVCDEAYLLLRRLQVVNETDNQLYLNENAFMKMSMPERDAEIKRWQGERTWIPLYEQEAKAR